VENVAKRRYNDAIGETTGAGMTVQTLKIGKREFVLVPKCDFERIAAQARRQSEQERQDAGDVAESRRRMKGPGGITLRELRKKLRR
jgi:hypothetical protein